MDIRVNQRKRTKMNYKKIAAEQIIKTVGEHLSVDEIVSMIEVPKYANQGPRFPCIYTPAKVRAPQSYRDRNRGSR